MDAREQIAALREQLRYHNEKYYNDDAPEISDYEYDMMQRELRALEKEHPELADADSPTQRVGGTASGRFAKVTHAYPLESLQDVFSFDELGEFYTRVENTVGSAEYVVEYKIDGLSRSSTLTASSCAARRAATVRSVRTSRKTSGPSRTFRKSWKTRRRISSCAVRSI